MIFPRAIAIGQNEKSLLDECFAESKENDVKSNWTRRK
jgi:hypothetical protein